MAWRARVWPPFQSEHLPDTGDAAWPALFRDQDAAVEGEGGEAVTGVNASVTKHQLVSANWLSINFQIGFQVSCLHLSWQKQANNSSLVFF